MHANVTVPAGATDPLEHLCRYLLRPPLVDDRLTELQDGRYAYRLKRPFRDGTTHVILDPLTPLQRLAALVSPSD